MEKKGGEISGEREKELREAVRWERVGGSGLTGSALVHYQLLNKLRTKPKVILHKINSCLEYFIPRIILMRRLMFDE